ncbi:hypothetical protein IV102_21605 [bacterium]|nr:hypothetical protein [bacterium]
MLKKPLVAVGLALAMLLPAQAEVSIDNVVAEMGPNDIHFRVSMHNMDDVAQQGPILVHLMARNSPSDKWREVQTWDLEDLRAGKGWSDEFSSEDEAAVAKANKGYEAKLVVEAPGLNKTEKMARQFKTK